MVRYQPCWRNRGGKRASACSNSCWSDSGREGGAVVVGGLLSMFGILGYVPLGDSVKCLAAGENDAR